MQSKHQAFLFFHSFSFSLLYQVKNPVGLLAAAANSHPPDLTPPHPQTPTHTRSGKWGSANNSGSSANEPMLTCPQGSLRMPELMVEF